MTKKKVPGNVEIIVLAKNIYFNGEMLLRGERAVISAGDAEEVTSSDEEAGIEKRFEVLDNTDAELGKIQKKTELEADE